MYDIILCGTHSVTPDGKVGATYAALANVLETEPDLMHSGKPNISIIGDKAALEKRLSENSNTDVVIFVTDKIAKTSADKTDVIRIGPSALMYYMKRNQNTTFIMICPDEEKSSQRLLKYYIAGYYNILFRSALSQSAFLLIQLIRLGGRSKEDAFEYYALQGVPLEEKPKDVENKVKDILENTTENPNEETGGQNEKLEREKFSGVSFEEMSDDEARVLASPVIDEETDLQSGSIPTLEISPEEQLAENEPEKPKYNRSNEDDECCDPDEDVSDMTLKSEDEGYEFSDKNPDESDMYISPAGMRTACVAAKVVSVDTGAQTAVLRFPKPLKKSAIGKEMYVICNMRPEQINSMVLQ